MSNRCNCCPEFVKTTNVVVDGGEIVLVVPSKKFENYERICLCICQCIPTVESEETVYIQLGVTGESRFQLETTDGNPIYSYQLKPRKRYPVTVLANNSTFVIHPKHLEKTTSVLTKAAPTTPTNPDTPAQS